MKLILSLTSNLRMRTLTTPAARRNTDAARKTRKKAMRATWAEEKSDVRINNIYFITSILIYASSLVI
jgi:hypothetical protein